MPPSLRSLAFVTFVPALRSRLAAFCSNRAAFVGFWAPRATRPSAFAKSAPIAFGTFSFEQMDTCVVPRKPARTSASVIGVETHPCAAVHASRVQALPSSQVGVTSSTCSHAFVVVLQRSVVQVLSSAHSASD